MQATRLIGQLGAGSAFPGGGFSSQSHIQLPQLEGRRSLPSSPGHLVGASVGSDYRALCSVGLRRRRPPWRQAVLPGAPVAKFADIPFRLEQMPRRTGSGLRRHVYARLQRTGARLVFCSSVQGCKFSSNRVSIPNIHPFSLNALLNPDARAEMMDVLALGNLCIDILSPVTTIPPPEVLKTETFLSSLAARAPSGNSLEVGGNCNFLIAASRIGLRCGCVGHLCDDRYGAFLRKILADEGISVYNLASEDVLQAESDMNRTLLCFVLTDGFGKHAFCSRYDTGPWPLLPGIKTIDHAARIALSQCSAIFVNGFVFDEMETEAVHAAVRTAKDSGAVVIFDPGPRALIVAKDAERSIMLKQVLSFADVILATVEEAAALVDLDLELRLELTSGSKDPSLPKILAEAIMNRPDCIAEWLVIKCGADGAALFTRDSLEMYVGSPSVNVVDTVGCGDSAAAAIVLGYLNIVMAKRKAMSESEDLSKRRVLEMLEETLALATAVGGATAMSAGAGRNVATAKLVRMLLSKSIRDSKQGQQAGSFGISRQAATGAIDVLGRSLGEPPNKLI